MPTEKADTLRQQRCCFTGHRPEKLHAGETVIRDFLYRATEQALQAGCRTFLCGMSRGVDLWAAETVLALRRQQSDIRLVCAVPYADFASDWTPDWQHLYRQVLEQADYRKVFFPAYCPQSFHVRNRWMVDHSCRLIAVYAGLSGGTRNTLQYALEQGLCLSVFPG